MTELACLARKHFPMSNCLPFSDDSLLEFSKLNYIEKTRAMSESRRYLNIWQTLEKEKFNLTDECQFLWRALKEQGFWLGSDSMNLIRENEVVELYSLNGTHLWFNLRYMEICSHTMEQIWSQPWTTRYKRGPEIDEACHRDVEKALVADEPKILACSVPEHVVEEVGSTLLFRIRMQFQRIAPVYSWHSKTKVGFIVTSKCKVLSAKRDIDARTPLGTNRYSAKGTLTLL